MTDKLYPSKHEINLWSYEGNDSTAFIGIFSLFIQKLQQHLCT